MDDEAKLDEANLAAELRKTVVAILQQAREYETTEGVLELAQAAAALLNTPLGVEGL